MLQILSIFANNMPFKNNMALRKRQKSEGKNYPKLLGFLLYEALAMPSKIW